MGGLVSQYDVVVVGAGPNGLAAGIEMARNGCSVLVVEGAEEPGGGARSASLTIPGYVHDLFSAVHPMAIASPFFQSLGLPAHGLEWIHSPAAVAHPLVDAPAARLWGTVDQTAGDLGSDGDVYRRTFSALAARWPDLVDQVLAPIVRPPRRPLLAARFGAVALRSAQALAGRFRGARARALIAGNAGHSVLPLKQVGSGGVAVVLALAGHTKGWPIPRGGAGSLTRALVSCLRSHGGELRTNHPVRDLAELPPSRVVMLNVGPHQAARMARKQLPERYRKRLLDFRYGPGTFKVDWALDGPIPWSDPGCSRAATVHVGGALEDVAESEEAVWHGRVSDRPFVILAQPSLFDSTRAPEGKHTAWAYCHVPPGWPQDMTGAIERQVERFAPGFRDLILARHTMGPAALESANPNLVGGDVGGGAMNLAQMMFRPVPGLRPYTTPNPAIYLCSASTPPGGGVHGMCGYHAARVALRVARPGSARP